MKLIKYLLLLSIVIVKHNASTAIDCMVICDKDDKETIIPIKDAWEITFDAGFMSLGTVVYNMNIL